jgi:Bacterial Ig-like domain (group 1)
VLDNLIKFLKRAALTSAVLLTATYLSGCGGSGAGAGGAGSSTSSGIATALEAPVLSILTSKPTVTTSGVDKVTLTVLAKTSTNTVRKDVPIVFASTDSGVLIAPKATKTDEFGKIEADVTFTGRTNRVVTISANAEGAIAASVAIDASGSRVAFVGPSTVVQSGVANYTLTVSDALGQPIADTPVTVTSSVGNTLQLATPRTDSAGKVGVTLTAVRSGSDTITASAAGASATQALAVSATDLSMVLPSTDYRVSNTETVTARLRLSGAPVSGATVRFSATRGTLSAGSAITDATGAATVTLTSSTAGLTTVAATAPDGTVATLTNEFVSTTPAVLTLQASPSIVGVNLNASATTLNTTQLLATVKDAAGNPVKNVTVNFTMSPDPSNGSIDSPGFAVTDSGGSARIGFKPGANATGANEIVAKAALQSNPGIFNTTTLTAARQQLQVRMGTGNLLEVIGSTNYRSPWSILVTDSAGAPAVGVSVQASLIPVTYRKGRWVNAQPWFMDTQAVCPSEDVNQNSRLDAGEDKNKNGLLDADEDTNGNGLLDVGEDRGDGKLTPGNVATVYFVEGTSTEALLKVNTDGSGFARLWVEYPKDKAHRVTVLLRVTATVQGTEGFDTQEFLLPVLATDVEGTSPPSSNNPFGVLAGCDNNQ